MLQSAHHPTDSAEPAIFIMTREELLLQLRDIQQPAEPAWWLLAPAYLVLAGLLILVLLLGWMLLRRKRADHQANRLVNLAAGELQTIQADYLRDQDSERLAIRISLWLKQVALLAFPHNAVQGASGEAWLRFLDQSMNQGHRSRLGMDSSQFSEGCGQFFGAQIYQADIDFEIDFEADGVLVLCEHWLASIKPQLQQQGRAQ
jgi:hypothetical protein